MRLTRVQRAAFFAGRWPTLEGDGLPPLRRGDVHRLSTRLSIEITSVRQPVRGGWKLEYIVHDRRPDQDRYLLPGTHSLRLAPSGEPELQPGEEHGYTSNPKAALKGAGLSVSHDDQNVITVRAHSKWAQRQAEEDGTRRAHEASKQLSRQIRDVAVALSRQGVDPLPFLAEIQREVAQKRDAMKKAA